MKRKFLVFHGALLLAMVFSILPGRAAAAQGGAQLAMEADKAAYTHGDTVTVKIRADQTICNYGMGITIFYDGDVLTPNLEASSVPAPLSVHAPIAVDGETALRISCFPGTQKNTFPADGCLAELTFRAEAPVETTAIRMAGVYQYKPEVEAAPAQELSLTVARIPVTGIALDPSEMTLEIQKNGTLHATVTPEKASDPTLIWTSDNEKVATVENGTVTAVGKGKATITATTRDGGFSASCTVTVKWPPDAGYIASMPGSMSATVGTPVRISPKIFNEEEDDYNAFDFTLSYDSGKLQLMVPEETEEGFEITSTISGTGSRVRVVRYGDAVTLSETGTAPFELEFIPLVTGEAVVTLVEARVDHSQNAILEDVAKASVLPSKKNTKIIIGGYRVTLDSAFSADQLEVAPNGTFTFAPKSEYLEFDLSASAMGGTKRPVSYNKTDDGDVIITFGIPTEELTEFVVPDPGRSFLIPDVTGTLEIRAESRGRTYGVTIEGTARDVFRGPSTATYGEDYVLTQMETGSFNTPVIKVGDIQVDWEITQSTNEAGKTIYILDGNDITSDFTITVNGQTGGDEDDPDTPSDPGSFTITASGPGILLTGGTTASNGQNYVFRLEHEELYNYAWGVKVGSEPITEYVDYDAQTDSYVIPGNRITGNITIEATRAGKPFSVTVSGTGKSEVTAAATAAFGSDYQFELAKKTGYTYTVEITIGAAAYDDWEEDDGVYTIPGGDITGNITIKVSRTRTTSSTGSGSNGGSNSSGGNASSSKKTVTVSFAGSCAAEAEGSKTATQGQAYTFRIRQQPGYRYDITVMAGDKEVKATYNGQKDEYTVAAKDVTGNLVITVEKTSIVEITEYITLDERSIFLVAYYGDVPRGQAPQYGGNNMFWSGAYNAYVWLTESNLTDEQLYNAAMDSISFGKCDKVFAVDYSGNADLSGTVNHYDASLVQDMYRGKYNLENLEMQKLLAADVTADKRVNVRDARSIADQVLLQEEGGSVNE